MDMDKLFFYPDNRNYGGDPSQEGLGYHNVNFKSRMGTNLHGWFVPSILQPKATIIHFHGNAANITNHWRLVNWIPKNHYNLFTFDYGGYGSSEGSPDFKSVHDDCLSAFFFIRSSKLENTGKLIVLGQSIGGAFCLSAVAADNREDIKGMLIDSSFDSFQKIADSKISRIPSFIRHSLVKSLISNEYSPIEGIHRLTMPKLFIHGTSDQVIPFERGQALFSASIEPKEFIPIFGGTHMSIFRNQLSDHMSKVISFLDSCSSQHSEISHIH